MVGDQTSQHSVCHSAANPGESPSPELLTHCPAKVSNSKVSEELGTSSQDSCSDSEEESRSYIPKRARLDNAKLINSDSCMESSDDDSTLHKKPELRSQSLNRGYLDEFDDLMDSLSSTCMP